MKKEVIETKSNESWCGLEQGIPAFLKGVMDYAVSVGINIDGFEIDHIGLRIKELNEVERLKNSLNQISINSEPISNSVVNGRPILIYKLIQPIEVSGFKIGCIELPYPKDDHNYPSDGWEHVEVVLLGNQDIESKFKLCFPDFSGNYKIALPETDSRELKNETLVVKNPENIMQCVKFHSNTIEEIIASEI